MKDIIKVCKFIAYDKEMIKKKPVKKRKHGNQHKVCSQGNSKWKEQNYLFRIVIPQKHTDFLKFRIHEDIFLPSGEYQSNSLGKLSVHPISNQYRGIRIDKRKNLLSTSLELYDLPVIPLEHLVRIVFAKNPTFAHLLQVCGIKFFFQFEGGLLSTKEEIESLTSIASPFDCLISKLVNQDIVTTQRIFNTSFLEMMEITEKMYRIYVNETGQQPSPVFYEQSDNYFQNFGAWFSSWPESKQHEVVLINYQGVKFKAQCTFKSLLIRCNVQNCIYRCCFWIYQVDNKWMHTRSTKINDYLYFDKQQISRRQDTLQSIQCSFNAAQTKEN